MPGCEGSNYLKSNYKISGCKFLLDEGSYERIFTVSTLAVNSTHNNRAH